ncbi:MAG: Fic family protein [Planctomycetota bacterium]|jgi:Fic family protein
MELIMPDQIALDETSLALIDDVAQVARTVNEYRPLPGPVVKRIQDKLLGERVCESNAIEGNTLDLRETVEILNTRVISVERKREALEARNLGDAVRKVTEWVDAGDSCHTKDKLLAVHATILKDSEQPGGMLRTGRVMIQGAKYQPPEAGVVEPLLDRLFERLSHDEDTIPLLKAVWAHWGLARIHPFYDGNGRIARLWQDLVLFEGNLTCAIIRKQDRREYLDALSNADEGDFNPLVQLIANRVSKTFDRYVTELAAEEDIDVRVKAITSETGVRLQQKKKLGYDRWSRKMEQLRWEFELCASKVTEASRDTDIHLKKYDLIDLERWDNIRSGAGAERTWFFWLDFFCRPTRTRYYYCFFFGKHYPSDELDNDRDRAEHRAALLISEAKERGVDAKRLDEMENCPITLRQLFVVEDSFVRKRYDLQKSADVYDRGVRPAQIALDFIEEVLLRRLV